MYRPHHHHHRLHYATACTTATATTVATPRAVYVHARFPGYRIPSATAPRGLQGRGRKTRNVNLIAEPFFPAPARTS